MSDKARQSPPRLSQRAGAPAGRLTDARTESAQAHLESIYRPFEGGHARVEDRRRTGVTRGHADLEVIIPTLNEESRIGPVLRALVDFLADQPWFSSVVLVDNGCTDRTLDVCDAISSPVVPVRVIGCGRPGKGAAVRRGVLATSARHVGFCDADLSTPVETIGPVMELMSSGHPMVIGSRRCSGARYVNVQPIGRRVGGAVFRSLARSVAPTIDDTQCGFKFFHSHIAKALFAKVAADGFAFDAEIVGLALAAGITVTEVPVTWTDAEGSSFRLLTDGYGAMRELLAVRARVGQTAPRVRELLHDGEVVPA